MDRMGVGYAFRAARLRLRRRQEDVAGRATVHRSTISLIERGHWDALSIRTLERVAAVLEIRLDVIARWRGGELDRLVNSRHSRLHELVAVLLEGSPGWLRLPEVSFAVFAERGIIDILAFHPASGSLLIIELKTEIVDVQDLVGTMDRRVRLAATIARERGWIARSTSAWVVVSDTRTNRRRLPAHRSMLRAALPDDGHRVRSWLRAPAGTLRALSFLTIANGSSVSQRPDAVKRVRRRS